MPQGLNSPLLAITVRAINKLRFGVDWMEVCLVVRVKNQIPHIDPIFPQYEA